MNLSRIRTTPRRLVFQELGLTRPTPSNVALALRRARERGYLAAYWPAPPAYDEPLIQVPTTSPIAALYRWVALHPPMTPMPRGLIESRVGWEVTEYLCGSLLGRYSLAIVSVDRFMVVLRPAPLQFAHLVNATRYGSSDLAYRSDMIVCAAIGWRIRPSAICDELRLTATLIYDEYGVDADGLLDGAHQTTLRPRWRFPRRARAAEGIDPPPF